MPFKLIKGTFHVTNYSPDGDSIRFMPEQLDLMSQLSGGVAKVNKRGHVQLRIEAIDALETHYIPPSGGGVFHQPLVLANVAREALLRFTGITNVRWDEAHNIVLAAADGTPGYILSRAVEKYGRPIAFVFAGPADEADGADVQLDVARLRVSYNHHALQAGLAYPTFYSGLFHDLRDELTQAVWHARSNRLGLHAHDVTSTGFAVPSLSDLTTKHAILPKLFRRITEYVVTNGGVDGFKETMALAKEPVLDLETSNFTHFDTFIEQNGDRLRMSRLPEQLVFDDMPAFLLNPFSMLMLQETVAMRTVPTLLAARGFLVP